MQIVMPQSKSRYISRTIICMVFDQASPCGPSNVYRSDSKREKYPKSPVSHLSHEHSDSNIVYDWTGPVLTICSIATLGEGDGALGPRVQGR